MSPNHLTSLWPPILTELTLVFMHMEHELATSDKQKKKSKIAALESFLGLNGYFKDPSKWLRLYLSVCKLLDYAMILPSEDLPHYQAYRWAFTETPGVYCIPSLEELEGSTSSTSDKGSPAVGTPPSERKADSKSKSGKGKSESDSKKEDLSKLNLLNAPLAIQKKLSQKKKRLGSGSDESHKAQLRTIFIPYISRIMKLLMQQKACPKTLPEANREPGQLILVQTKIRSIYDLIPFFVAVVGDGVAKDVDVIKLRRFRKDAVELWLEKDFVESPQSM